MAPKSAVLPGTFVELFDVGVLITGESGLGKSELALALIERGHRLVADDAPEFFLQEGIQNQEGAQNEAFIEGSCRPEFEGFLQVYGLGMVNVSALFGAQAVLKKRRLDLSLELCLVGDATVSEVGELEQRWRQESLLGIELPCMSMTLNAVQNRVLLVEVAVRLYRLRRQEYDAAGDFIQRQQAGIGG